MHLEKATSVVADLEILLYSLTSSVPFRLFGTYAVENTLVYWEIVVKFTE